MTSNQLEKLLHPVCLIICKHLRILKIKNWSNIMSVAIGGNVHHIVGFILTGSEYIVQLFERCSTLAWLLRQDIYTILA
jgi:hypothetical protein